MKKKKWKSQADPRCFTITYVIIERIIIVVSVITKEKKVRENQNGFLRLSRPTYYY